MNNYSDNEIYELCNALYKYEILLEQKYKGKGYLIETKKLDKLKKSIDYKKLVSIIEYGESYRDFIKKIKKHEKKEVIKVENFQNSNELQNELLKDKKFNIIDNNLNSKIRNGIQTNAIDFILEKGMITIIFNENDKIYFKNNENGIINKSSLMKNSLTNNSFIPNNNSGAQESNRNDKFLFNTDLEILIRIFHFNKYLREKKNDTFKEMKQGEKETIYLINISWINEYKSFFDYEKLETYITNDLDNDDISNNYLSNSKIEKIIKHLPSEYINKINKKEKFDKNKLFNYEKKEVKDNINYTYNNYIINSKVYEFLTSLNYKLNDSVKKYELYFIGYNKILLIFSKKFDANRDIDEIGYINKSGIFIPEFVLKFEIRKFSYIDLNTFLRNNFSNFISDKINEQCKMKDNKNNIIGQCYKVKDILDNEIKISSIDDINKDKTQNINKDKSLNNQENSYIENYKKEEEDSAKKMYYKKIEIYPYIELMLNIYIHNDELNIKLNRNMTQTFK